MSDAPVVIITGGGRGIGFGTAEVFAGKGYRIAIADRDGPAAETAAGQLLEHGAPDALGLACDVADRSSVDAMVAAVVDRFGRIDALVNNAGICPFLHVMDMDETTWKRTIDVNLHGPFHCTRAVARWMIDHGVRGRIVFITSLATQRTNPTQVDYAASKAGVRMAMAGFATALGPHGINCTAVAPGHVCTDLTRRHWESDAGREQVKQIIPLQRLADPKDIGRAVAFLCSDEASYISGVTLRVDGGNSVV